MTEKLESAYTKEELKELRKAYEQATPKERRGLEIRDLGYPLTSAEKPTETVTKTVPGNKYYVPE